MDDLEELVQAYLDDSEGLAEEGGLLTGLDVTLEQAKALLEDFTTFVRNSA